MSELKPVDNGLPISEDALFKLPERAFVKINQKAEDRFVNEYYDKTYPVYYSSKLLIDKVKQGVISLVDYLFTDGVKVDLLEQGKHLQSGRIKSHLVLEFIPDEPELTEPESPLDDIRKQINNQ